MPGSVRNCVAVRLAPEAVPACFILASPKSSTFTCPRGATMMFAGLISRCTIPLACAASSASATCNGDRQGVGQRQRRAANIASSVWPSMYSMARKLTPVRLADLEDARDIGMAQCARRSWLPARSAACGPHRAPLPAAESLARRDAPGSSPRPDRLRPCRLHPGGRRCGSAREWRRGGEVGHSQLW